MKCSGERRVLERENKDKVWRKKVSRRGGDGSQMAFEQRSKKKFMPRNKRISFNA